MLDVWSGRAFSALLPCGKRTREFYGASGSPTTCLEALLIVRVAVNGVQAQALIDIGCGKSIISPRFSTSTAFGPLATIVTINEDRVSCQGYARVLVECSGMSARIECLVLDKLVDGVDVVLGMDAIELFGGVMITSTEIFLGTNTAIRRQSRALTSKPSCGAACGAVPTAVPIDDRDFEASFDGKEWTARWKLKKDPAMLRNTTASYDSVEHPVKKDRFDKEVQT